MKETLFDIDRDLGDGTATAAILLAAIVDGGFRLIRAGFDPEGLAALLALAGRLSTRRAVALFADGAPGRAGRGADGGRR